MFFDFSIYCQENLIKILLENKKINHLTLNSNLTFIFLRVINETVVWFRFYDVIIILADSVFSFLIARAYIRDYNLALWPLQILKVVSLINKRESNRGQRTFFSIMHEE